MLFHGRGRGRYSQLLTKWRLDWAGWRNGHDGSRCATGCWRIATVSSIFFFLVLGVVLLLFFTAATFERTEGQSLNVFAFHDEDETPEDEQDAV